MGNFYWRSELTITLLIFRANTLFTWDSTELHLQGRDQGSFPIPPPFYPGSNQTTEGPHSQIPKEMDPCPCSRALGTEERDETSVGGKTVKSCWCCCYCCLIEQNPMWPLWSKQITVPQPLQTWTQRGQDLRQREHIAGHGGALGHLWSLLQVWKAQQLNFFDTWCPFPTSSDLPEEGGAGFGFGVVGKAVGSFFFDLLRVREAGGDMIFSTKSLLTITWRTGCSCAVRTGAGARSKAEKVFIWMVGGEAGLVMSLIWDFNPLISWLAAWLEVIADS